MDIEIKPCDAGDLKQLRRMGIETFEDTFASMNSRETMDDYLSASFSREKLLEELHDGHCLFYFLNVGGEPAGYLKLNHAPAQSDINDPESLEIERIYLRKIYKGKSLGRVLMDHALGVAGDLEKAYVWLGVWEKNVNAIAFYMKMGFHEAGRHAFQMGDELQNDLIMKRII